MLETHKYLVANYIDILSTTIPINGSLTRNFSQRLAIRFGIELLNVQKCLTGARLHQWWNEWRYLGFESIYLLYLQEYSRVVKWSDRCFTKNPATGLSKGDINTEMMGSW